MATESHQRHLTAYHEAGHAVATLLRGGGELLSITIEPADDYLGHTLSRTKAVAQGDRMFVTFAGPWAEARARWPLSSLNGEDNDGITFDDYLAGAWLGAKDGDLGAYEDMRLEELEMLTLAAEHCGITPGELRERQERGWSDELERAWGVIQQVTKLLLTGATVTDAVVRELVEGMWDDPLLRRTAPAGGNSAGAATPCPARQRWQHPKPLNDTGAEPRRGAADKPSRQCNPVSAPT